jgi:hypothetical protein
MTRQIAFGFTALAAMVSIGFPAGTRVAAQSTTSAPIVFQAAGPTAASIQSTVDAFRAALGANNGNVAGPLAAGRREINWDGGGSTATSLVPTPFDGFLVNRGARFTTPGTGFVQAPVEGIATTFGNPPYANIFQAFSPVRLFSAIGSNRTDTRFFIPGGGELPATTRGFGAVFSDVDTQLLSSDVRTTAMTFYGADGKVLHAAVVPSSPGTATVSFVGVLFEDPRIAAVRIRSGHVAPNSDVTSRRDVVMMDDFIFGEPQAAGGAPE